jgi:hypothetical protein
MSAESPIIAHRKTLMGSERSFGVTFAALFAVIGSLPLLLRSEMPRWWAIAVSITFLTSALTAPRLLAPLNILWFKFGLLLHHIINPILMALIYFVAVVPTGLMLRMARKDLLRLEWDTAATSYWIMRNPPGPLAGTMTKQF